MLLNLFFIWATLRNLAVCCVVPEMVYSKVRRLDGRFRPHFWNALPTAKFLGE